MIDPNKEIKLRIDRILADKSNKNGIHIGELSNILFGELDEGLFAEGEKMDIKTLTKKVNGILSREAKKKTGGVYLKVKNPKTGKDKKGFYKIKKAGDVIQNPKPIIPPVKGVVATDPSIFITNPDPVSTLFIGKAGECAVMSELLFRGYNANSMMVDDGVDVVASKNNVFYFIQVKTTTVTDKGRIHVTIKKERFEAFAYSQIRYIVVARCLMAGLETNLYFIFNNQNIDEFISYKYVSKNAESIFIKIKIDKDKGNTPMLYHENNERDIRYYMNRFDL